MGEVTIIGDRMAGKSYMLVALAEKLMRRGFKVLYVAADMNVARERLYNVAETADFDPRFKVYRGNGNEHVKDLRSDGAIYFSSARSNNRGLVVDTLILDDGVDSDLPAKYVYRATL